MEKSTRGVKFFDLFEGMDSSFFYGLEADRYKLAPQSTKRRWLPGLQAQEPMARNIW
eukprot:COSAG02_NODE_62636_length_265_cov_0.879518_1_plen_56_part_10